MSLIKEPIAIVGSACRFAGDATSTAKLWELLKEPKDVRTRIPETRFNAAAFHHPDGRYHGHSNVRHSYMLTQDPAVFDTEFFGIKPVEARALDPQQRLLLETVYEGLEAAGIPMERLRGTDTGVYVGLMCNDYEAMLLRDIQAMPAYHTVGTQRSIMANRISYFFDWHGPSMVVDTACSSSLVAVHLATQALRSGEARTALACGSNLLLGPEHYIGYSKLQMLSPDGQCKMWDDKANGYGRGEGVGCLVLKTLRAALEDGDQIECIIRETGMNQDGTTRGITMPSATAQAALIRDTYVKAGLDPTCQEDRCQYFEAHGTGTPAGDPIEAEAIMSAFFPELAAGSSSSGAGGPAGTLDQEQHPLYVGSVKTVLGHTEGTAGIASILKASLALQHGRIPPNLLFTKANPAVLPFMQNLEIVTGASREWPSLAQGQARRVSVNNFGFGGTNAHVILESYDDNKSAAEASTSDSGVVDAAASLYTPFVFSARSKQSLVAQLSAYSRFLDENPSLNLNDLAGTLRSRRSVLPFKAVLPACTSIQDLKFNLDTEIQRPVEPVALEGEAPGPLVLSSSPKNKDQNKPVREKRGVLGIFTGQGAQYARMGAELIEQSAFARGVVQDLENHLALLPDGPTWSLTAELLSGPSSSRVQEAVISQPLCTAVQILLVDMLRLAGVKLDVVVGHSSGEIGAAYAAGRLSAAHAMYVAYYRGLHCQAQGKKGAMLAVATSMEDAAAICGRTSLQGRVAVAAHNSSSSVTLSGDAEAIAELEDIFEQQGTFRRRLRVDTAYHSHHMAPCAAPYMQSLRSCGIQANDYASVASPDGSSAATWLSSVREGPEPVDSESLQNGTYWAANMVQPVMFSGAIARAVSSGDFATVLEIGPHPALKGPVSQTILEATGTAMPYHGMLMRGTQAIEATSSALGFLWSHLPQARSATTTSTSSLDLDGYEAVMSGRAAFRVLKNLPSYQWDHHRTHWHESRVSRATRLRKGRSHQLLGDLGPDSSAQHLSWRNVLRTSEMPWLDGHRLQGQTVFPAAGYIASALEACRYLAKDQSARLIEVRDFDIVRPMVFEEDDAGVEVLVSLDRITPGTGNRVQADFTYSAALGKETHVLTMLARGHVAVLLGDAAAAADADASSPVPLGTRQQLPPNMIPVDADRFYSSLSELGYAYNGPFRALRSLVRKLGHVSGEVTVVVEEEEGEDGEKEDTNPPLMAHPAVLDSAIQSLLLARSFPKDGQLDSLHVPTRIELVRVAPALCGASWAGPGATKSLQLDATSSDADASSRNNNKAAIVGDLVLSQRDTDRVALQLEGVKLVPLAAATPADDKQLFSHTVWAGMHPDGEDAAADDTVSSDQQELAAVLERISTFYLRTLDENLPQSHPARAHGALRNYMHYARHVNRLHKTGQLAQAQQAWLDDTLDDVMAASARFSATPDVKIMHAIGTQMPRVLRGETTILEHLRPGGLLDDYYVHGLGLPHTSKWLARTARQITHRYPRMRILEIGAGTGGATKSILQTIGSQFDSYTFTDISTGFFEQAQTVLPTAHGRMVFKALDIERDPVAQGFEAHGYDMVVASFVIHATGTLATAMANIRRLLRPGGFVVVAEITDATDAATRVPFIFGTMPGWWAGVGEGRVLSPCVPPEKWDALLVEAGFSGIDTITPVDRFDRIHPFFVFVSQAVDERVNFLREPLSAPLAFTGGSRQAIEKLVIIGGTTLRVARLVTELKAILGPFCPMDSVLAFKSLLDVDYSLVGTDSTVLSLTELDRPVFQDLSAAEFDSLKTLLATEKTLLWITSNRRSDNPFSNMTAGFVRSALCEVPELRVQMLDVEGPASTKGKGTFKIDARLVAETLLRFELGGFWAPRDGTYSPDTLLWAIESDVVVDVSGRQVIPRLEALSAANERYNSARRRIARAAVLNSTKVEDMVTIFHDDDGYFLGRSFNETVSQQDDLHLRAVQSTLSAIKTPLGHRVLTLAVDPATDKQYLCLGTSAASSFVTVPPTSTVAAVDLSPPPSSSEVSLFMLALTSYLISATVLDGMVTGQILLIHNAPNTVICQALEARGADKGVHVLFSTDSVDADSVPASWLRLPRYAPRRAIQALLPRNVACFADLSEHGHDDQDSAGSSSRLAHQATIRSCLGPGCRIITDAVLSTRSSSGSVVEPGRSVAQREPGASNVLGALLQEAAARAVDHVNQISPSSRQQVDQQVHNISLPLQDIAAGKISLAPSMSMVKWACPEPVPVRVERARSKVLFKHDKTYWLVGLTGSLGLSLCEWMIDHGAKHIVITSRNPHVDPAWVEGTARKGAVVQILGGDVSNKESITGLYAQICATLPPIVGVVQGAMVLQDTPIRDMSFEQLTAVTQPKVQGSLHLDAIFQHDKAPLDFMVFFSSILETTGNMGQANYTAANAFMSGMAAQRRSQGLAASVVRIGVILGVGYVAREVGEEGERALHRSGLMGLSESDVHDMFHEAVMASSTSSSTESQFDVGIRQIRVDSAYLPTWFHDPKFARFIVQPDLGGGSAGLDMAAKSASASSIKDRLRGIKSLKGARMIIKEAVGNKLRAVLQMDTDDDTLMRMRTDELGLDSLIAVDLRSWLLKYFEVDVPVLKILGGLMTAGLVDDTLHDLPAELIPNIDPNYQEETISKNAAAAASSSSGSPSSTPSVSGSRGLESSETSLTSSVESLQVDSTNLKENTSSSSSSSITRLTPAPSDSDEAKSKNEMQRSMGMSFSQSLFWVVDSMMPDKSTLNHTVMFRIAGSPRVNILRNAVALVGHHHEALRTCFFVPEDGKGAMQGILKDSTLRLEQKSISDQSQVQAAFDELKRHAYDLAGGQVMRIVLLSRSASENYLLIGFHHINVDGISHQILLRDLDRAYRGQALDRNTLQYPDYFAHQLTELQGGAWNDDIAFWTQEFAAGIPDALPITRSRLATRRSLDQFTIHSTPLHVDAQLADRIRSVARANKATSFHYYLTAFKILLHRLTGAEDLCIGIADGNRSTDEVAGSIGPYLNLVPLRFRITPEQTFGISIAETRSQAYAALAHARLPFERLLGELRVARSPTHTPVFQAFVDYRQGAGQERQELGNCVLEMLDMELGRTGYDLSLDVIDNPGADARVTLMGQGTLYAESDMKVIANCFEDILHEFVQSPRKRISEDWQYRQADVDKAVRLARGALLPRTWPEPGTLMHRLDEVVQQQPDQASLVHVDGSTMAYRQMWNRADTIASALLDANVESGQYVGVFQESTLDWICSMLAIWKINAVYVPLDPGTKTERLSVVVKDCAPVVILMDAVTVDKHHDLCNADAATVFVNVAALPTTTAAVAVEIRTKPDALAMVYYTSGSTGAPKGIAVKHEGLGVVFEGSSKLYGLDSQSVLLLQSSLGFDMTLIQMMLALPNGGTVAMISRDLRGDSAAIVDFMVDSGVTHTAGTPSEAISWMRFGDRARLRTSAWRVALCGAEPLTGTLLEGFRDLGKDDLQLYNIYGATETTVYATQGLLNYQDEGCYTDTMPAGKSLPNKAIYIVDEQMKLLPQGLAGEIVMAGAGVGEGYVNNEAITKASFVPDPYACPEFVKSGWTTMYRTKDRGRLLADGSVSIEGRMGDDTEIKLRGLRIDLKDIEQTILRVASGDIAEAVASVRAPAGTDTQFLVAHVVFSSDASAQRTPAERQKLLRDLLVGLPLPVYMCPTVIVPIAQMPMTLSGKLDRKAVAALTVSQPTTDTSDQPADLTQRSLSDAETQLKAFWEQVLPRGLVSERITASSDFFHVGGTSLLLVQLQDIIKKHYGISSLRLAELFSSSTLETMAQLIIKKSPSALDLSLQPRKTAEVIDWEWETRPSPDLQLGTALSGGGSTAVSAPAQHPKVVLLTGCAGFLGRHLLQSLLAHPHIETIYCVAVRQLATRLASGLLPPGSSRLIYCEGDLRDPLLGLPAEQCTAMFNALDAVIHNGADVSHLKSYATLRRANLFATQEIARLCLPRAIPLHYISTAGVSMFTFWQSFGEETASAAQPPTDGTNGYKASKWASERYLERVNEKVGLPMWLHRPSDMVREDDEEAQNDLLHTLLGYSRRLRAVPVSENLWGWLDLVAVDTVSDDVVQKVVDNEPRSTDGGVSYVHQTGDMAIPIDGMKEFFEEESGYTVKFEKLPIDEWARRANEAGMKDAVAAVFGNVPRLARALCFPRFIKTWKPSTASAVVGQV